MVRPFTNDLYLPVNASRMNDERGLPKPNSLCQNIHNPSILKAAFTGIWSVEMPQTLAPCPRTGHFYHYDETNHVAYIGYGLDSHSNALFDLWALDTLTDTWKRINLCGEKLQPRTGARCAMVGNHLVIFGGYSDPDYFSELHTIDVSNGLVQKVNTTGPEPSARSSPIVTIYNNKFFVWGGFNGEFPSELNILDLSNFQWTQKPQDVGGRTAVPHAIIGNKLYSYGGSKSGGMIILDLDNETIDVKQTIGAEPPSAVMSSGMVAVDHYVFFFGGKANSKWTLMYACDVDRLWWFVFHLVPDGETVSLADGTISEFSLFMVPRIHSFAVCYVKEKRKIMAFLGHPINDPPPLFNVAIGDALPVIHLREDMLDLIRSPLSG
ncbi:Kelch motif family protein [Tritrichomonas foetus]|uniref:Kelch motif family protein n=1 Tax=Tritrichomonas foetus TaxID=1144522 RepID=A0A1J4K3A3_9EUKA|nr:Kelch motif family protein [Tritrichomonas foetus]|eukprot:OHT05921.1 Kelch motif family protein [Tritrichomonas foetus]